MVKKIDFQEFETMAKGSCDIAISIRSADEGKEDGMRDVDVFIFAPDKADVTDAIFETAEVSARFLMELAGERRQQQAMLLLEYMRRFTDTVMELVDKGHSGTAIWSDNAGRKP